MGSMSRQRRTERFIKEFGDLAIEEYGLPGGIGETQGIDLHPVFEVAFIYVTLTFPSGSYLLMVDKIIFDPEQMDADLVEQISEDYENAGLTREQVIEKLKKAELIEQNFNCQEEA